MLTSSIRMCFSLCRKNSLRRRGREAPYTGLISAPRSVIQTLMCVLMENVKQIYEIRNVAYCHMWHIAAPAAIRLLPLCFITKFRNRYYRKWRWPRVTLWAWNARKAGDVRSPRCWERTSVLGQWIDFCEICNQPK